jgi:hypothetical protein
LPEGPAAGRIQGYRIEASRECQLFEAELIVPRGPGPRLRANGAKRRTRKRKGAGTGGAAARRRA